MLTGKPPTMVDLGGGQLIVVFESRSGRIHLETNPTLTASPGSSARFVGFDADPMNRLEKSGALRKADRRIDSGDRYAHVHPVNPIIR
jgi:hypothetical protein